jgi:general L-amino acid transport system permease protein
MWYVVLIEYLPSSETPYTWFNSIFLSQEGLALPVLLWSNDTAPTWMGLGLGLAWSLPTFDAEGIHTALNLSTEFIALTFALIFYTSAFIAENVRAGIESIPQGQIEAARSVGLSEFQVYRFVLLPQSIQMIRPPLTNQYLNLIKNSSLAVAIGYPDLVSIANTAMNQTGRALECISILMAVYLVLSLGVSWTMNQLKDEATLALERESSQKSSAYLNTAQGRTQGAPISGRTSHE